MKLILRDSTTLFMIAILCIAGIAMGCKSKSSQPSSTSQNTGQGVTLQPTSQQMSVDDLVAPIALYPDQLLAQVLAVSVNPQEVLDLGNWLLQNQNLQADAMTNAVKQAGFGSSAQYLAHFPQVVDNMCQQMDWTRQLGEAFKADQKSVMDAVQRKRSQAQQVGNLKSSPQMTVENKKADNGESYVQIQPADPKVVYVPQYNPVTIYNNPAPAAPAQTTTTTTEKESGVSGGEAAAIGLLSFGVGMALGAAINNDYYGYPYPSWGYHSVYVARGPYYPAAYRAPGYAGYRPAYGYNPPGNYRWNQYNRNVNATINNNYYNRFNNTNANTRAANARQTYNNQNRAANTRSVQDQSNLRGQSTYQGARSTATQGQRPGASMANAIPRDQQYGQRSQQLQANRSTAAANRPNGGNADASNWAANRASRSGEAGSVNRSDAVANAQARQTSFERSGDRGYSGSSTRTADSASFSRDASAATSAASSRMQSASDSGGAFGGGGSSGRQERTASSRGRASMGEGGTRGGGGRRR
jgi:hypothetical protein